MLESTYRCTDPKTAPNVPVYTSISVEPHVFDVPLGSPGAPMVNIVNGTTVTITIAAWDRATDEIMECVFVAESPKGTLTLRPPTPEDREWLRNIGAQGKDQ